MTLVHVPFRELPQPSPRAMGGTDSQWSALVPSVWAALADPEGRHPWPSFPTGDEFAGAWFMPALHLLAFAVAWPRLDLGAAWWQDQGYPDDEPVLALVSDMLGAQRREQLVAWMIRGYAGDNVAASVAAAVRTHVPTAPRPRRDEAWFEAVNVGMHPPLGNDNLHLSMHLSGPIEPTPPQARPRWFVGAPASRRAVLVVDHYAGWYRTLAERGDALPTLPEQRSWRVDVVCTPVGHLGTFRRSRLTGRWFSGRHRSHQPGWGTG